MSDDANPHGIHRHIYVVPNTKPTYSNVPNTSPVRSNVPNTKPLSPQFTSFYNEPDPAGEFAIPKDSDLVTETSLDARKKAVENVGPGLKGRKTEALKNVAIKGRTKTHG